MGPTTDVFVVGGGPAGLAAAIAARKKGFQVIVADGARPPIDKACGEGLLPGTLAALRELGIDIQAREGQIFRGIRFIDGTTSAKTVVPGEGGVGVRRTVLQQKMVERAEECGIELLWNAPVTCLAKDSVIAGGKSIRAKWIVGADGVHSRVRRWSGLEPRTHCKFRFAQRRHFCVKLLSDCVEVYWGRKIQAYVTPLAGEETCVVLISRDSSLRFVEALREFPALVDMLRNAELSSVHRGTITTTCGLDAVYRGKLP